MNILFVCKNLESANGICVISVAKELAKQHKIIIINSTKIKRKENNIEYVYLPDDCFSRLLKNKNNLVRQFGVICNKIWIVLMYSKWPFSRPLYYNRLVQKCKSIVKENRIDVIIPVYGPIETVLAAMEIKKKSGIVLIPYFLDSLLGGPIPRFMSKEQKESKALKVEKMIAESVDKIFMMLGAKKLYSNCEYANKIEFLDLPLLVKHSGERVNNYNNPKGEIIIVFVGNISKSIRNPEYILSILSKINIDYKCYIVGNSDCESLFEKYTKFDRRICKLSSVSYDEAQKYLREADFLLNIGNSLEYMVPSKIFEYFSYSKPIISTQKIENDPTISYLYKYKKVVILNEQDEEEKSVKLLESFLTSYDHDMDDDTIYQTFYLNTPQAFAEKLERVLKNENKKTTEKEF